MLPYMQGLILSKALNVKKDAKDESTWIAFENLQSEIIEHRHQAKEKEIILNTLANEMIEVLEI